MISMWSNLLQYKYPPWRTSRGLAGMFYICSIKSAGRRLLGSDGRIISGGALKIVCHLILPSTLHANHIMQCKKKLQVNVVKSLTLIFSFKIRTVTLELIMLNSTIHFFLITWPSVSLSSRARGEKKMNALQCARYVYKTEGIRGFYRGLTASYAGISETMICFLIYETLKKYLAQSRFTTPATDTEKGASDFLGLMFAAAFAKGCASCIAYPHGRLLLPIRQSMSKYIHRLFPL